MSKVDDKVEIDRRTSRESPDGHEREGDETPTPDQDSTTPARKRPLYKRPVYLIVAGLVLLIALVVTVRYWLYSRSHESTDDAFIDGHIIQISPKVTGYISRVYVTDNQQVQAGFLIAEIDPRDFEARLAQAKAALSAGQAQERQAKTQVQLTRATGVANVQQATAGVRQARSGVKSAQANAAAESNRVGQANAAVRTAQASAEQSQAELKAAEAEAIRANADVGRYQALFDKDEISHQRLDQAIADARTANAQVEAARQRVNAAAARVHEAQSAAGAAAEIARRAQTQIGGAQAQVGQAIGKLTEANTAPKQVAVSEA